MAYGHPDVYHQPESFGLTIIGSLYDPEACYSFNDLIVWEHEDGRIFYASDSGCSCPSPFEDYTSLDDLELVTLDSWDQFANDVATHCLRGSEVGTDEQAADRTEILSTVSRKLRAGRVLDSARRV